MARYSKSHAMYESLKYEDIVLSKPYAITLSPADQKEDYKDRRTVFIRMTKNLMITLGSLHYKLHFEWSPLGIMHWHGIIQIYCKETWFKDDLPKLKGFGHFCIKEIKSLDDWVKYCSKQNLDTIEHINWKIAMIPEEGRGAPREFKRSGDAAPTPAATDTGGAAR